jgi:hypothetical protein
VGPSSACIAHVEPTVNLTCSQLQDQTASLDGLLAYFDLTPSAFPWSSSRCSTIASTRSKDKTLFYDELLMLAGVGEHPPSSPSTRFPPFQHLPLPLQTVADMPS